MKRILDVVSCSRSHEKPEVERLGGGSSGHAIICGIYDEIRRSGSAIRTSA